MHVTGEITHECGFLTSAGTALIHHKSKMCALPNIVRYILLLWLPLPSTASSTRSPRSCHLAVAGARAALPASMTKLPAVLAGSADSAGTPQPAYPTWELVSAPCQQSCRASARYWPARAHVAGKRSSLSKFDPHPREGAAEAYAIRRQPPSFRSKAMLIRKRDWVATRSRGKDYSYTGKSPPRPLPSQGNDIFNSNRLRGDRPRDRVKTSSTLKGAFSNTKKARGAVYENVFLGWHVCAARSSPSRWRALLACSAPADSSSRRHCRGTGTRCFGPRCPL
jgi:hypothetical protein